MSRPDVVAVESVRLETGAQTNPTWKTLACSPSSPERPRCCRPAHPVGQLATLRGDGPAAESASRPARNTGVPLPTRLLKARPTGSRAAVAVYVWFCGGRQDARPVYVVMSASGAVDKHRGHGELFDIVGGDNVALRSPRPR